MTPRELTAALAAHRRPALQPLGRASLDGLMRRFPDGDTDGRDDRYQ
jgi:uncharacterized phage protein (TIGR02216 family)